MHQRKFELSSDHIHPQRFGHIPRSPFVHLVPGILDNPKPVGIDDEALGTAGSNLIRPEKRSRPGLKERFS